MNLDYSGLTEDQIVVFVDSTTITVEVDARYDFNPTNSGEVYEGPLREAESTGWLTGQILGININENLGRHHEDVLQDALEVYKEANGHLAFARVQFLKKYPMLITED